MKLVLLILSTVLSAPLAQADLITPDQFRPYITHWEGNASHVYSRPIKGGKTEVCVGIGHHFFSNAIPLAHSSWFSPLEIERFYHQDFASAVTTCEMNIPTFDQLPKEAQIVCLSLAWTTGRDGFKLFNDFILSINHHFYSIAAINLVDSKRTGQVGKVRALDEYNLLASLGQGK